MAHQPAGSGALNDSLPPTPGAYPSTPGNEEASTIVSTHLSLSQAVYRRRAEFTRSYTTKVKVGTWNVASLSGTDKDIEGWFVGGKGLSESLNGLAIDQNRAAGGNGRDRSSTATSSESTASQERRRSKKKSTMPKNDTAYLPGGAEIGLYVLGLQEIVDISSAAEALRPYTDPHPGKKWKQAVEKALPKGYQLVAEQQLIGLYMLIYASPSLAPQISSVSTTSVGTGLMGYMGNKGAVTARIVLGETTRMVFINCHLTAGVEKGNLERRNWDAAQIVNRTKFDPVYDGSGVMEEFGEGIGDEDFAFWFGDLNYRLESLPGDDVRRLLMLHTRNEYGKGEVSGEKIEEELAAQRSPVSIKDGRFVDPTSEHGSHSPPAPTTHHASSADLVPLHDRLYSDDHIEPATDPASLQTTLSSLLPHDQLHAQMRARKAFHDGWQEGPIDFLPTYKYDVGSVGMFDSSEKKRGPSWCDRILYRTRRGKQAYDGEIRAEQEAKRQEDEMKARGINQEAEAEAVLFDYDPDTDADNDYQEDFSEIAKPEIVETKAGFEDKIHLDYYTSHQRVLSSDHKPLDAVFTLTYDAVDPQMKAKVHQEVARELDKAENEGRPVVTVVIDHHHDHDDNMPQDVDCASFEGVNFGHVKYNHPKTRTITVANTGRVPATVGFVDRAVDHGQPTGIAPSWLSIHFDRHGDNPNGDKEANQQHTLEPGDAANVELTVHIKEATAVRAFNEGRHKVEDVLVLRIYNGRDYFLPLRGIWLQSSFGRSVDRLLRIPEGGIRKLQHQRPDGNSHSHDDDPVKWSAPREIFRLTEAIDELVERTVAEWGMKAEGVKPPWENLGWPFAPCDGEASAHDGLSERIREALDTDQAFQEVYPQESSSQERLEAVAGILVEFLTSLEDGVITEDLWTQLEKGIVERGKSKVSLSGEDEPMQILEVLSISPAHSVLFNLIIFMLSGVAGELQPVGMPSDGSTVPGDQITGPSENHNEQRRTRRIEIDMAYASIFAKIMIRAPTIGKDKDRKASEIRRKHLIETFLRSAWDKEA